VLGILLICWPLVEIFVAIKVADALGVLWTLLLLVAGWPLGTWAIRSQGAAALRRLGDAIAAGRSPEREVLDGVLVLAGGALLMVPGFITDVIGLCLLLAPTRAVMRGLLVRNLESRLVLRATGASRPRERYDVDSTATDVEQRRLRQ
jgi:UPF0716 protein FxsA